MCTSSKTDMQATNLQNLREWKGFTPGQLAQILNVSYSTVHNWESGRSIMRADMACRLADFYGVSLDIVTGREPVEVEVTKKLVRTVA